MLSVIREFVAPLSVPKLVRLFVPIVIAPAIVPPAFARYAAETAVIVARSLRRVLDYLARHECDDATYDNRSRVGHDIIGCA